MFRFIVCDKDNVFCEKEKQFISDVYKELDIRTEIDIYHSGEEIIALGEKLSSYHAIFLGVSMEEGISGIDLGGWLNSVIPELLIVFVSDHMHYALEGYKIGVARYIMKDEKQFRNSMEECLEFILRKFRGEDAAYITIADKKTRVSVDKILYVESKAHKITYHLMKNSLTKQEYTVYGKLDDAERELLKYGFCRIHQSYLVNMSYVSGAERYKVMLLNGMEIPISKKKYKSVEDRFLRERGMF